MIFRWRQSTRKLSTSAHKIIFKWLLWFDDTSVFAFVGTEDNVLSFIVAAKKGSDTGRYSVPKIWQVQHTQEFDIIEDICAKHKHVQPPMWG